MLQDQTDSVPTIILEDARQPREGNSSRQARNTVATPNSSSSNQQGDFFQNFEFFRTYFDNKLSTLKSDILSEQDVLTKKFREESSIKFRSEGNRIQYRFKDDIYDGLHKVCVQLLADKSPMVSVARDLLAKLKERNKHIRIADNSSAGWATVKEYETNDVADNEEDEKRIRQAESRAIRVAKDKKTRQHPYPSSRPQTVPAASGSVNVPPTFDVNYRQPFRGSGARREPGPYDLCHQCRQYGHWKRQCPLNNAGSNTNETRNPGPGKQ